MSFKLVTKSSSLKEAISFVESISRLYSGIAETNKNSADEYILIKNKDKKSTVTYAKQGVMVRSVLESSVCEDGFLVIDPYIVETIPSRANETTLEVDVDRDKNKILKFCNGSSRGSVAITDDAELVESHIPSKDNIPNNFIKIANESMGKIISLVLYDSTDERINKKIGLPVRIAAHKNKICVQTGDSICGVTYKTKSKEVLPKIDILTQGLLLKQVFNSANKNEISFASNEKTTRIKTNKFEIIVPTQEMELPDINTWMSNQPKPIQSIEVNAIDIYNAVNDACVVSNIANITDPVVTIVLKDKKAVVCAEESIGKSTSTIKANFSKQATLKYDAIWFNQMSSKIKGKLFIDVFDSVSILRDENNKINCIVPFIP